jgi:hypothetical protein
MLNHQASPRQIIYRITASICRLPQLNVPTGKLGGSVHSHRQSTKQATHIQHAIGEASFVVVPSQNLHQTTANPRVVRIEITGKRIVIEINRDKGLFVKGQRSNGIALLRRGRAEEDESLKRALLVSFAGVTAGMRNTG